MNTVDILCVVEKGDVCPLVSVTSKSFPAECKKIAQKEPLCPTDNGRPCAEPPGPSPPDHLFVHTPE